MCASRFSKGHYIPNLVARPFELSVDFLDSILAVVPSESVKALRENFDAAMENPNEVAREILVELLAWQFASPVRWIETQNQIITMGIEEIVEVGLGASPTLANMAIRTLALPEHDGAEVTVYNVQRDAKNVLHEDVKAAPAVTDDVSEAAPAAESAPAARGCCRGCTGRSVDANSGRCAVVVLRSGCGPAVPGGRRTQGAAGSADQGAP